MVVKNSSLYFNVFSLGIGVYEFVMGLRQKESFDIGVSKAYSNLQVGLVSE